MGLKNTLNSAVLTAFKTLDDLNSTLTYKSMTGTVVRDLDAGTSVAGTVDYTLKYSVFVRFKESEVDENVSLLTDSKLLFPTQTLPATPKASDIVTDPAGRTWEITRLLSEPSSSVTVLHVRTSK